MTPLVPAFGDPDRTIRLIKGSYLFRRGDPAWAVFVVKSGRVRLERSLEDGTPVTLAILRQGDGVAEAALFTDQYHCDARAEVESRLWRYPKQQVLELIDRDVVSMQRLVRHLAGQVRRLRAILEIRSIKRADDRVMAFLDLLESFGEPWDEERPTSTIGAELGLTPEALYRTLARLEKAGRIRRQGRKVLKKS